MGVDYIVVGQGLAGTVLSYTLLKRGKKVLVIDNGEGYSSSKAAAGIFNPVTGKRLVKTWQADTLFPFLHQFYTELEQTLQQTFFYPKHIYRPFVSIEEQNSWIAHSASPELAGYTNTVLNHAAYGAYVHNSYGGIQIRQSGYVNVQLMLETYRTYLKDHRAYRQERFCYQDIIQEKNNVRWKGVSAKKILFCEGPYNGLNPYFKWLPFKQVKGELLVIRMPDVPEDEVINRGVFVLPVGNGYFKVGATYQWDNLDWMPSAEGKQELLERLQDLIKVPFRVTDHQAGIRPASLDRRPFIGLHPVYQTLGIFNGLGTKGISVAPYYAGHFAAYLEDNKELNAEVHINRYFSLYYKSNV